MTHHRAHSERRTTEIIFGSAIIIITLVLTGIVGIMAHLPLPWISGSASAASSEPAQMVPHATTPKTSHVPLP